MEGLIESGFITGVLDITTTELCDRLFGGVFPTGPTSTILRLRSPGDR
jgi:uncharacterized protein (UPF0261 family)